MAGLLDMHLLAGNAQTLTVLRAMAAWAKFRMDRLTYTQRQNTLDTEFGGMNEVLTTLCQLTGARPPGRAGAARFAITTGGWSAEQQITAPAALPTGVWTHVFVVLTGGAGVRFVNGSEVTRNNAMTLTRASFGSTTQNWVGRAQSADPYLDGAPIRRSTPATEIS